MEKMTYRGAGVDIDAGNKSVSMIKDCVRATYRSEVLGDLGGFGGLFALNTKEYKEPVLVSGTDGVGTKLRLAFMLNKHDTIGQDAVAMCVNDILVQGAEPLFFLDYLAVRRLAPEQNAPILCLAGAPGVGVVGQDEAAARAEYGADNVKTYRAAYNPMARAFALIGRCSAWQAVLHIILNALFSGAFCRLYFISLPCWPQMPWWCAWAL